MVLAHKAAINAHLGEAGIPVGYTNVFWGGRSEIKPSEISPIAYAAWRRAQRARESTHSKWRVDGGRYAPRESRPTVSGE